MVRLGVDTGGTFTDFVWLDDNGRYRIHKQLSTPDDPSKSILSGVEHLALPQSAAVVHGTTVATNALLERRGARTALITTEGFADVLAIGRQNRPDLYALVPQKTPPLVPAAWRFTVAERVTAQGEVLRPFDPQNLLPILQKIADDDVESVAVCLLFSFLHPAHEQQIKQALLSSHKQLHISLSSEILPEYREYERTATTVLNAYVAPLMGRYLSRLAAGLDGRWLTVMQSNGGIIQAATAVTQAARTALSGPAGGVVGGRFVSEMAGYSDLITFDMGGTSTDVALCPGRLPTTTTGEIADLPLRLPIIDIHTVGAGGGSLATVDAGGALRVGPQSAGADPGPACYNTTLEVQGQQLPYRATTTDANLVLGRLDADNFLGGQMHLNEAAAFASLEQLARQMGVPSATEAAWGVIQIANANMERAVRRISVERGHDPRRFTLVAFGGAGPLHACELAQNLQIPRVLVPAVPGVLSALGMLAAAPTKDYSQTVMRRAQYWLPELADWLQESFGSIKERAIREMSAEGYVPTAVKILTSLDMRYTGQSHELTINYEAANDPLQAFHKAHLQRYGYQREAAEVEIVNLRVTAVAPIAPPKLLAQEFGPVDSSRAKSGEKAVWFDMQPLSTALYQRDLLQPGMRFSGPAIVFQYDTTTVIPPMWETAVDQFGNLIIMRSS